jgi:hypothetical protein
MELNEVVNYLGAAAASDGPIDGRENDLLTHLMKDFGATSAQASDLVASLKPGPSLPPNLNTLTDRDTALRLLRGLLVISYCDGSFDKEEVPFVTPLIDKFSISGSELTRAKRQALYFLGMDPPSIQIPPELVQNEKWDDVCQLAHRQYDVYRKEFYKRFQDELDSADKETCYLAMAVGPPSFDTEHTERRFIQSNPDFLHLDDVPALQMLRDEAERRLRNQWEAAYSSRCNFCFLEAPGRRRDLCPKCKGEYGVSARR